MATEYKNSTYNLLAINLTLIYCTQNTRKYLVQGEILYNSFAGDYDEPHKFTGYERDNESGLYHAGARPYWSEGGIMISPDQHCFKYPNISAYNYSFNNPVMFNDPTGMDGEVVANEDGTYKITGGTQNSDRNIYIMKDGKRTGEVLGQMLTEYSFFDSDNKIVTGAIINPNDQSGQNFIDKEIKGDNPNIVSYMANATNNEKYDFKSRGDIANTDNTANHYRGMPLKDENGKTVYGSARDVGNYGAGYVAGKSGLNWRSARAGFDMYQSYKDGKFSTEPMVTQAAERLGYNAGWKQYSLKNANDWVKRLFNMPTSRPKGYLGIP